MMWAEETLERLHKLLPPLLERAAGELCQPFRIAFASDQCSQDGPTCRTHHNGRNRRELEVGIFEHFVKPVDQSYPIMDEFTAIAGQVAQFPQRTRRNKAAAQQTMAQEFGDPGCIVSISLVPRDRLHMLSIDDE